MRQFAIALVVTELPADVHVAVNRGHLAPGPHSQSFRATVGSSAISERSRPRSEAGGGGWAGFGGE